ncbi:Anti-sigma regulatory factor (Ser/Thr protein kinase) [Streptomyces prasinopilosus]|uniref:Anti-sigma regulatory factor (Ser/Thr protein kinase) n=1 Tax=Streptomyces prasinopilosus TaxID=67344 RepID=A0A1G6IPV3_9ACTN|nr:Anti-sigma regulatory factor (Ser/Thr protein kinase) [Streptomyces prasinopilosus]
MPETDPSPWEYSLSLPNDPRAVTVCRRTLRLILTVHGLIGQVDVAELLAAELIGNAVRHTKGPAALRVRCSESGVLRIGAWDADPSPPEPPRPFMPAPDREGGRGLALVRACADVWGWQPLSREGSRGKYVWCELGAARAAGGAVAGPPDRAGGSAADRAGVPVEREP